jgi:hypothetical protein
MNTNIEFCRILLRKAREDARANGIEIPKLVAIKSKYSSRYEIWSGKRGKPELLWQGEASNAYEAKANCIEKLIRGIFV